MRSSQFPKSDVIKNRLLGRSAQGELSVTCVATWTPKSVPPTVAEGVLFFCYFPPAPHLLFPNALSLIVRKQVSRKLGLHNRETDLKKKAL